MPPFRKEKIASLIRTLVSEAIAYKLADPRIATMTTITRVEMTGDLTLARVYLTVTGGGADERKTLRAIRHAGGFLRSIVAHELTMRQCPELRFEIDEQAKAVSNTLALLAENRLKEPHLYEDPDEEDASEEADDEPRISDVETTPMDRPDPPEICDE